MATKIIYAPGLSGKGTTARARAWIGRKFSAGWCLYWCLTEVFKVPGLGDYDHDGAADAEDYWKAAVKRGKVIHAADIDKLDDIAEGAGLLMWTGGSHDNGHAAYPLGRGRMTSTDAPTRGVIGEVDIEWVAKHWGLTFVGIVVVDANGFTLTRDQAPPAPPATVKHVYKARTAVNIRDNPNVDSPLMGTVRKGSKVTGDRIVAARGREWISYVRQGRRVYVAREYFDQV